MRHTGENAAHRENEAHWQKCGTLGKMGQTWENEAHWGKSTTLGKMRHTRENAAQ